MLSYKITKKPDIYKSKLPYELVAIAIPVADMPTGVNVTCSIFKTCCPQALYLMLSCFLQQADKGLATFEIDEANSLKKPTSTNVHSDLSPK